MSRLVPGALLFLLATAALAQPASSLVVGPGILVREKAYLGAQPEVIPIPWIEMRAGRFSLRGLQASFDLGGQGPLRLAAIGNLRLGGVESGDLEPRMELFERDPTVELGLAATLPFRSFRIGAEASADVLGQHGGWDAALRVTRMVRAGRLVLIPGAGLRYWSGELASYEYGLEPGEAGFAAGHEVGGAAIPEASLAGSWALGPKWSLVGFARASRLGDGMLASPIVGRRTEIMGGFGLARRIW
jgi:outer membrane protein